MIEKNGLTYDLISVMAVKLKNIPLHVQLFCPIETSPRCFLVVSGGNDNSTFGVLNERLNGNVKGALVEKGCNSD